MMIDKQEHTLRLSIGGPELPHPRTEVSNYHDRVFPTFHYTRNNLRVRFFKTVPINPNTKSFKGRNQYCPRRESIGIIMVKKGA
jgi:hypothetical protein